MGGSTGHEVNSHTDMFSDAESVYSSALESCSSHETVVYQNIHKIGSSDSLFYTTVLFDASVQMGGMLDSGSMACSISERAEQRLRDAGILTDAKLFNADVVLVGCGGLRVKPKSAFEVEMEVYGCKMLVPTLVVQGQHDDVILGANVIKHVLRQLKQCDSYWQAVSSSPDNPESLQFLSMLSGLNKWQGDTIPDKVGTVRCNSASCLEPGREYLLWGKLPKTAPVSPGATVLTEPTSSRSAPRGVLVAKVVTHLWGDRWVPVKLINTSDKPVLIRRNAKLADVYTCVALEDVDTDDDNVESQLSHNNVSFVPPTNFETVKEQLISMGLTNVDIDSCEVSDGCKSKMANLVLQYQDIFSRHHLDCGKAKGFVHRIRLSDNRPFRLPFRRVPPSQYQKLRQVLTEMEEKEIIRKSNSEYASPLVLVWKKNGDLRICTDFRWLNKRTLKDAHPLPHQSDCLAALGGNCLFSTMDLTSGFYNMPLHENDRQYSAFTTPMGLYEYNRLPQGLCNSPGSFMRMMTSIFGDQNYLSLLCYLDDLLVFAPDENTALKRIEMVFSRLRSHNLKLSPKKCFFLRRSVKFLGHVIDENGVSTDPSKVESISNMSCADLMEPDGVTPSPKRLRSFLGMVNYYQHFVPGYSAKAKPLFELLKGEKKKGKNKSRLQYRKLSASDWTSAHVHAFERLKDCLLNAVVLAHPDFSRPFVLSTDASLDGIGAVLSQVGEGESRARPIAFASKSLTQSQRNYPAHRLEFLALKWAVCDKFSHWLKGHTFSVLTDNNPLTHILTKPKLDCCEQRWVAKLASYDFDIKYVPGQQNVVADALSRVPFVKSTVGQRLFAEPYHSLLSQVKDMSSASVQQAFRSSSGCDLILSNAQQSARTFQIPSGEVSAVLQSHICWDTGSRARAVAALQYLPQLVTSGLDSLPAYTEQELRDSQLRDRTISRVLFYVERNRRPSRRERAKEPVTVMKCLKHWEKLTVSNGVLYRVSKDLKTKSKRHQYVVPDSLKTEVLHGVHDEAGHQAQSRTLSLARQRFFWLSLDRDVRDYVRKCQRCVVSKTADPEGRAPLESIVTSRPLELVCIDFWSAEDSRNKSVDVLVITDHFTRMAQAFPCKDQTARQVAKVLWNKYFCVFGFPERIHSDQGPNFESELISELLEVSGVRKSHTTPYHPMGNGSVERFNRTLGGMIRALPPEAKVDWPRRLQTLTFVYNCTSHETTGFPPFYLMFGRVPRLPVDVLFRSVLHDSNVSGYDKYVESLVCDLKEAMVVAQEHVKKEQNRHALLYNRKVKGSNIEIGEQVLLANKKERGKRKLADRWESTIYTVMDVNQKTHTYRISDNTSGKEKIVHRNLLMPVNFLPLELCVASDVNSTLASGCSIPSVDGAGSDYGGEQELVQDPSEAADSERRTVEWVSRLTECDASQADISDLVTVHSAPCDSDLLPEDGPSLTDSDSRQVPGPISTTRTGLSDSSFDVQTVHAKPTVDRTATVSTSQSQVRTRFGRLVKPVNRLIQTMSRQDVIPDTFSVKGVCKSVFQTLTS